MIKDQGLVRQIRKCYEFYFIKFSLLIIIRFVETIKTIKLMKWDCFKRRKKINHGHKTKT